MAFSPADLGTDETAPNSLILRCERSEP